MASEGLSSSKMSGDNMAAHMAFVERFAATQKTGNRAAEAIMNAAQAASDSSIEEPTVAFIRITKRLEKEDSKTKRTSSAAKSDVSEGEEVEEVVLISKEEAGDLADLFSDEEENRDYHLDSGKLSELATKALGSQINENSTPHEILQTVKNYLKTGDEEPDVAIVNKAVNFLLMVTRTRIGQTEAGENRDRLLLMLNRIEQAKEVHYEAHSVDIQVTDKIISVVDVVTQDPNALSVKETLDIFRNRISNPTTPRELFDHYRSQKDGLKGMEKEVKAFKRFIGANLERKNIERAEILQLMDANQTMWALLGLLIEAKESMKPQIVELARHNIIQ